MITARGNRCRARFPKESTRYLAILPGAKLRYKDSWEGRSFPNPFTAPSSTVAVADDDYDDDNEETTMAETLA